MEVCGEACGSRRESGKSMKVGGRRYGSSWKSMEAYVSRWMSMEVKWKSVEVDMQVDGSTRE